MNTNCGQCIDRKLCKLCELDLKKAKVEWQLKPLEVQSSQFEPVAGHTCQVCLMTFVQSSHLNTHVKLKHGASKRHVCPQCPATFAQMNNFVVHFKKNHLICDCKNTKLCDGCIKKVAHAKRLAGEDTNALQQSVEDSLREMFAGEVSDIESGGNLSPASNVLAPIVEPSLPLFDTNAPLTQPALSLALTLSTELSSRLITTPLAMATIPGKRMKPSETSIRIKRRRTNVASSGSVSQMETITTIGSKQQLPLISEKSQSTTVDLPLITPESVYDKMLGKIHSTQISSELAHITKKSKEKHLNRANVDLVLREAAKSQLDIDFLKKTQDIEKYWIIATYFRRNSHIEYAKICKEIGADLKRLESFLEHNISCEEAMGMYPGSYVRLKNDFKHNGANTEVRLKCLSAHNSHSSNVIRTLRNILFEKSNHFFPFLIT